MNDFSELEAELKQLRPAATSPDLMTRVERALAEHAALTPTAGVLPRRKVKVSWFALGFGVAAAATFLMLARVNVDRPASRPKVASTTTALPRTIAPAERSFLPDGVTRVVYNRSDEGLVFPRNADRPARRVRSRSHETLQWKDPGSGASLRVSYPTEEVELIPVRGQ